MSSKSRRIQHGVDKLLWRPMQVADSLEIGRSKTYALIASGVIPSVRIGASVRVPTGALKAWVAEQTKKALAEEAQGE